SATTRSSTSSSSPPPPPTSRRWRCTRFRPPEANGRIAVVALVGGLRPLHRVQGLGAFGRIGRLLRVGGLYRLGRLGAVGRLRAGSSPSFQNVCHWLRGLKIRSPGPPTRTSSPSRAPTRPSST